MGMKAVEGFMGGKVVERLWEGKLYRGHGKENCREVMGRKAVEGFTGGKAVERSWKGKL